MSKRIVIAAGGTGGHIYPAMELGRRLIEEHKIEVVFIAGGLTKNPWFERDKFIHHSICAGQLSGKNPVNLLRGAFQSFKGFQETRGLFKQLNPQLVVGFGSYHSFPVLAAAQFSRIPFLLHEANSFPGRVNRLLSSSAQVTALHFPEASSRLKGKSEVVAMPLWSTFSKDFNRENAIKHYGLDPQKKTVLIFGGSQGARFLNEVCIQAIPKELQVIHLTGSVESVDTVQSYYHRQNIRAIVKCYEKEMAYAWMAADLVIGRSGAGTVAEMIEYAVPGILIPYPHAVDNHQEHNADHVLKAKGAIKLLEKEATIKRLSQEINALLTENRLETMRQALQEYKKKRPLLNLCGLVCKYLNLPTTSTLPH